MRKDEEKTRPSSTEIFLKKILMPQQSEEKTGNIMLIGEKHDLSEIRKILIANLDVLKASGCSIVLEGIPQSLNPILAQIAHDGKISSSQQQKILDKSTFVEIEDFILIALAAEYKIPVLGCETQETDPRLPPPPVKKLLFFTSQPPARVVAEKDFNEFRDQKRNSVGNLVWGNQLNALAKQNRNPIIFLGGMEHIVGTKPGTISMQTIVGSRSVSVMHQYATQLEIKEKVDYSAKDDRECKGTYDYLFNSNILTTLQEKISTLVGQPQAIMQLIVNQIALKLILHKSVSEVSFESLFKRRHITRDLKELISLFPEISPRQQETIENNLLTAFKGPKIDQTIGLSVRALTDTLSAVITQTLESFKASTPST